MAQVGRVEPVALRAASRSCTNEGLASSDSTAPAGGGDEGLAGRPQGGHTGHCRCRRGGGGIMARQPPIAPQACCTVLWRHPQLGHLQGTHLPGAGPPCCSTAWRRARGRGRRRRPGHRPRTAHLQSRPAPAPGFGTRRSGSPVVGSGGSSDKGWRLLSTRAGQVGPSCCMGSTCACQRRASTDAPRRLPARSPPSQPWPQLWRPGQGPPGSP